MVSCCYLIKYLPLYQYCQHGWLLLHKWNLQYLHSAVVLHLYNSLCSCSCLSTKHLWLLFSYSFLKCRALCYTFGTRLPCLKGGGRRRCQTSACVRARATRGRFWFVTPWSHDRTSAPSVCHGNQLRKVCLEWLQRGRGGFPPPRCGPRLSGVPYTCTSGQLSASLRCAFVANLTFEGNVSQRELASELTLLSVSLVILEER